MVNYSAIHIGKTCALAAMLNYEYSIIVMSSSQIEEAIIEEPSVHVEIIQSVSDANVLLRITFEFSTFTTTELVEIINYKMSLTTLGGISVDSTPQITIFESTGTVYESL